MMATITGHAMGKNGTQPTSRHTKTITFAGSPEQSSVVDQITQALHCYVLTSLPDRYLCQLSSLVVQKLLGELSLVPRLQHSRM